MIQALLRKLGHLTSDAALRRWLLERMLCRTPAPPAFTPHRPPYLASLDLGQAPKPDGRFGVFASQAPQVSITLDLAGLDVAIEPAQAAALFERSFADIEQCLALHRFAWIDEGTDPAWVALLWSEWRQRFSTPDESWPWHPYTAAERAINLLAFAERCGLPEPADETRRLLALHATVIAGRLEYFGPHYTGNHLANDGRGLFRLGTALGWNAAADLGGEILLEEARRIFGPSGVLIEGSSHYHLLLAKNYGEAASWAAGAARPEAAELATIATKAKHAAGGLLLTGGLPLIGDISPDLPPRRLTSHFQRTDADLSADGWHRFESGDWSLLLYAPPDGWPPMPGHGHQDLGSFELHWKGEPLIVDPGRGRYGEEGEAALYRSSAVHNGITCDGRDPRPANRPYYAPSFRKAFAGAGPEVALSQEELSLSFPMDKSSVTRRFEAKPETLTIADRIEGKGHCLIERGLVTPHPVTLQDNAARIHTPKGDIHLQADMLLKALPITRWNAYGRASAATRLVAADRNHLPWQGLLTLRGV